MINLTHHWKQLERWRGLVREFVREEWIKVVAGVVLAVVLFCIIFFFVAKILRPLGLPLPIVARRVEVFDAIAIWSLSFLVVFEGLGLLFRKRETIRTILEVLGLVSLGVLAFADILVHQYRIAENGLLSNKQEAFEHLVSDQSGAITLLTNQVNAANTLASRADVNNAALLSTAKLQSQEIDRLRKKQDGPFTWNISLVFPSLRSAPNQTHGAYSLGSFTPDKDITITRVVTPFAGRSFVVTANGAEACSHPPFFYLSSGPDRGVVNAAYVSSHL